MDNTTEMVVAKKKKEELVTVVLIETNCSSTEKCVLSGRCTLRQFENLQFQGRAACRRSETTKTTGESGN